MYAGSISHPIALTRPELQLPTSSAKGIAKTKESAIAKAAAKGKVRTAVVKVTTRCEPTPHVYLCTYDPANGKITLSPGGRAGGLQLPHKSAPCCAGTTFSKSGLKVGEKASGFFMLGRNASISILSVERIS